MSVPVITPPLACPAQTEVGQGIRKIIRLGRERSAPAGRIRQHDAVARRGKTCRHTRSRGRRGSIDIVDHILNRLFIAQIDIKAHARAVGHGEISAGDGANTLAVIQFTQLRIRHVASDAQIGRSRSAVLTDGEIRPLHFVEDIDSIACSS